MTSCSEPRYLDILKTLRRWSMRPPITAPVPAKALLKQVRCAKRKADRRLPSRDRRGRRRPAVVQRRGDLLAQGRRGALAVAVDDLLEGGQRVGGPAQLAGRSSGNVNRHRLSPRSTVSSHRNAERISRRRNGSERSPRRWRARATPAHRAPAGDGSAPGPTAAAQTPRSRSASAGQWQSTR
jgi:hypothetical protein